MRIGLIVPGFSADQEDWCIPGVRNLVRELACRHDVRVFALRYPYRPGTYRIDGAVVHALGGGLSRGVGRLRVLTRAFFRVSAEHRRRRLDLVHALWADEPGFLAALAAARIGVPSVVSLMGGELAELAEIGYGGQLGRVSRGLVRAALRRATAVTVGSAYLRDLAAAVVPGVAPEQIPIGVDAELFHPGDGQSRPSPLGTGEVRLLHVASLAPVKDQSTLLRAFALAAPGAPGAHLHIVGEGPLLHELRTLAGSLGISARVTFHGAVAHERLPAYYRAADLCVLSSRHESQSLVALEAAACGRATIGTAVGILPELAPATRVVPVGDAAALAEALAPLLRDARARVEMGRAARRAALERYSLQRSADRFCALYARVIARNQEPGGHEKPGSDA